MFGHHLLPSQSAEVFDLIRIEELDPREFEWEEVSDLFGGTYPRLRHRPSGFYLDFRTVDDHHYVEFSPGRQSLHEASEPGDWNSAAAVPVLYWLRYLKREVSTPDVWGQLEQERQLTSLPAGSSENTPFTETERALIAEQFNEMRRYVAGAHALDADQLHAIEARLDYLVEAAGRTGRIDWRNAFVGAMTGLILEAIVPGAVIRDLFQIFGRGLAPLFGLPELPPG